MGANMVELTDKQKETLLMVEQFGEWPFKTMAKNALLYNDFATYITLAGNEALMYRLERKKLANDKPNTQ